MMDEINTSWIWADVASGGVKGARVDLAEGNIEWVDQPGCACHDAFQLQSVADFLAAGPNTAVPQDVAEEMRNELERFKRSIKRIRTAS